MSGPGEPKIVQLDPDSGQRIEPTFDVASMRTAMAVLDPDERLAYLEARRDQFLAAGYDRAIANLRDEARLLEFMKANDDALYLEDHELFARYLEAVKDQP